MGAITGAVSLLYPEICSRGFDNVNDLLGPSEGIGFLFEILIGVQGQGQGQGQGQW